MVRPTAIAVLVLFCGLGVALPGVAQPLPKGFSPGSGTIWMGSYSGHLTAVDEATGAATKVPLTTGPPFAVRLSPDRTRFYVQSANMEKFEVVDAVSRRSLDSFTLSDARRHVRALTYEVDPQHKTMVIVARTATHQIARWEISPVEILVYDLTAHRVTRTLPWTIDPEPTPYSLALRFSPDGRLLYLFANTVTVLDVATMQDVDSWDLSRPADASLGRFEPGPWDDTFDPQGTVTSLFEMQDPVMHRPMLVVGQVNLAAKTVETFPLGPVPQADGYSFHVSPDRKTAHVLLAEIGRHQLWTIDMTSHQITSRVDVPTRTRMQMRASSNGQALYIYEAGRTIEVYSADAKTKLRTIELDSDMMYATFTIVPGTAAVRPAAK